MLARTILRTGALAIALAGGWVGAAHAQTPPIAGKEADGALLKQFNAAGRNASITVLPVGLAGHPNKKVGEVIGMLLERRGMEHLEVGSDEFKPPADADLAQAGTALGAFVKGHPIKTDFALFADVLATPERKITEIRILVVDRTGDVVWSDRQTLTDADFKRISPTEPMQCCVLVTERLATVLNLGAPDAKADKGRIVRNWEKNTGLPTDAERAAMAERLASFKKVAKTTRLTVYPIMGGGKADAAGAENLANLIKAAGLNGAIASKAGPLPKTVSDMNEQKVLWSMARSVREAVRQSPPDTDYVLFAEYLMGDKSVGAVHFVVCDRQGEWVLVDYQNSHLDDFQAVHPKDRAEADRLVVRRLKSLIQ